MHCISENTQEFQIIQKVLLANKIDLNSDSHRISREEGLQLAEKHRIDFFEVSAKDGRGIDGAFLRLAELVVEAQQTGDQVRGCSLMTSYEFEDCLTPPPPSVTLSACITYT